MILHLLSGFVLFLGLHVLLQDVSRDAPTRFDLAVFIAILALACANLAAGGALVLEVIR